MSEARAAAAWHDAVQAAALLATAPDYLGGVHLRALPGPVRDSWLDALRGLLPATTPLRRIPPQVSESGLLGGIDLAATLRAGRPVAQRGLLVDSAGVIVLRAMAERAARSTLAHLGTVLDFAELIIERDGLAAREPVALGVVALDESVSADEALSPVLHDRLALVIDLQSLGIHDLDDLDPGAYDIGSARRRLAAIAHAPADVEQLCAAAIALGIGSLRVALLALRVARVAAALRGGQRVDAADLAAAARLVLAPRATCLPPVDEPAADTDTDDAPPPEPPADGDAAHQADPATADELEDRVLEAALAAIPEQLLARLGAAAATRTRAQSAGRSGAVQRNRLRGRPLGARRGDPRAGARLSLIDTLRAAAPWQPLRRRQRAAGDDGRARVLIRRDDFHVVRFSQRAETTTIFVVDASGSAALHRLAEAKGAVELLLADCYVRRDQVALIAFRGHGAELLLPPTRSLVRAKRCLAALPGGGATPLAAGLDAAAALCEQVLRRGGTPTLVCLTDGRANVGRAGAQGRAQALADALDSARALRLAGVRGIVIDTSPRPHAGAERLAQGLDAVYLPLPHADAARLTAAVQQASQTAAPASGAA